MRILSALGIATFGLSVFLCGCGATAADSPGEEAAVEDGIGQARAALVSCYGDSCNGQDPGLMGCEADAGTLINAPILTPSRLSVGTIAIRYSAACNAVWARASTIGSVAFLRAELSPNTPGSPAVAVSPTATTALRSSMIGRAAGSTYTARGFSGPSYGYYPNQGQISR